MNFLENVCRWKNNGWSYFFLALIVFLVGQALGAVPLILTIFIKNDGVIPSSTPELLNFEKMGIDPNIGLILMLFPFIVSMALFIWLIKPFNDRSVSEVINGTKKIRWNRFYFGFGLIMIISVIMLLISVKMYPENYEFHYEAKYFWPLILVAVIFFPIQASFEEIFFRGYTAQQVSSWTKNRWIVILVPSLLFALMHVANPEVAEFGFYTAMGQYLIIAIVFGITSILDDGIELCMGMHTANNAFLAIFLTFESSVLPTKALYSAKVINPNADLLMQFFIYSILLFILGRYYSWDWKILSKPIIMNCPPGYNDRS